MREKGPVTPAWHNQYVKDHESRRQLEQYRLYGLDWFPVRLNLNGSSFNHEILPSPEKPCVEFVSRSGLTMQELDRVIKNSLSLTTTR